MQGYFVFRILWHIVISFEYFVTYDLLGWWHFYILWYILFVFWHVQIAINSSWFLFHFMIYFNIFWHLKSMLLFQFSLYGTLYLSSYVLNFLHMICSDIFKYFTFEFLFSLCNLKFVFRCLYILIYEFFYPFFKKELWG